MPDRRHTPEALAFDIAFALRQSPHRVKTSRGSPDVVEIVAESVVKHLLLCGWRLEKKPPEEPH